MKLRHGYVRRLTRFLKCRHGAHPKQYRGRKPGDMLTDASTRKAETLRNTLGNLEAKALVNALADTLLEVEQETLRNSFADVMTKALIAALPRRLAKHWATWRPRH